jgi:RNA polymerase sigma-70 factor (ECF subfamily)
MSNESFDRWRTHSSLLIRLHDPEDQAAWVEFDNRYRPMIRRWCHRWFPHDTEDLVQEVFTRLVSSLRDFQYQPSKGRFRGYLKTVTNRLMAEMKERVRPVLAEGERVLDQEEARRDLWERLAAEYDLELLEIARERVRGRVAERTWSAYVETAERGRTPAEVALELGMRVGTVYQARYSVLTELRREIAILEDSGNSRGEVVS